MALRLIVESQNRAQRFSLAEGENRLGSGLGCPVRIAHPSVSRQHAMIYVHDGRAEIEDLGSRNGTRIGDHRITRRRNLDIGQILTLGSVEARLEEVSEKDLEAAVTFRSEIPRPLPRASETPDMTTLRLGSLQTFTLDLLPGLLTHLTHHRGSTRMAQEVGGVLFECLPCLEVEVLSTDRGGVLFRACRNHNKAAESHLANAENELCQVRVSFMYPAQAHTYAPLLECATLLIRLADTGGAAEAPLAAPRTNLPALPEPTTLVPRVLEIYADGGRVAQGNIGVLISGESGTGKEVLARYLHAASPRAPRPFVALNCAALPRDLLESELFGIESGVATGVEPRPGKFEMADGGTLFLDEVGDMALETQARILRVLQEGEVYRLGGQKPRSAEVRVVTATHRNLDKMMAERSFRTDLYHRIADWTVELPPLRERRADIPNLAAFFLDQETRRRGVAAAGISRGAMDLLEGYEWPGNIRQLEREMARTSLFIEAGELLESSHLREAIRRAANNGPLSLKERLEKVERTEISQSLARKQWSVTAAAKDLKLGVSTLYRRMRELGIEPPDQT